MNLYIRIVDGKPYEHPLFEDNVIAAFPYVDLNNLPPEFARFKRVGPPIVSPYQVYEGVLYQPYQYDSTNNQYSIEEIEYFTGGYHDVHVVRDMTEDEKQEKRNKAFNSDHPEGWVFIEEACDWRAPLDD